MGTLRYLAERLIGRAEAEGDLRGLKGEGQPLPQPEGGAFVDPVEAAGFRIMAREGALPPEVILAQQANALRAELKDESDPEARKALMRRLADIEMRRAMRMEGRRRGRF
ncbi:DUF1992 domain-containing protein [Jannaschia aquimarina]|uniref:DnaJ homologue subfamily C member 28 conserved domain-containing protein n=1 Tax=Jannaschia aquimarina TaxID=935700 RepID=A0A0D1EIB9_9RHOB|nr:DUF1992 domain-containing protein [Jannaschia aquimarina]KIT16661.1 hypothetical protein jaqu_16280 [Jannaschia aquimarina]SNS93029.1 protein of unknown function [Jannaschia aquimarina]